MDQKNVLQKVILRVLRNALFCFLFILAALVVMSYLGKWYQQPDAWMRYGNFLFVAGIVCMILGGFLVGGVRQMPMGQGAFIQLQVTGTESDLQNEAKARLFGLAGMIKSYAVTISLFLAGITALIVGVVIQNSLY
jgi:hypothetical protein